MFDYDKELIEIEMQKIRKNNPNVYTKKDSPEGKYIFIF
jgi:argonaute-like protein implicated in RNA metabolism and viral defense